MRDAEVEGPAQHGPLALQRHVVAEVVPQAERDGGQLQAAAAAPAELHRVVAAVGRLVTVEAFMRAILSQRADRATGAATGPMGMAERVITQAESA